MKKVSTLFVAALLLCSAPVFAECEGGVEFNGRKAGTKYCVSNITMNWWSAFAWCQAQGYRLASFEEACTDATSLIVDTASSWNCGNISTSNSVADAWLSRAWNTDKALHFCGAGCSDICRYKICSVARTSKYKALCIE